MTDQASRLPQAHVCHRTSNRLRIRIPSRKGDARFFATLKERLIQYGEVKELQVNPLTGSLLLVDERLDPAALALYARKEGLCELKVHPPAGAPLSHKVAQSLQGASRSLERLTGGSLDLTETAFLALVGIGLYQLLRGDFRVPPWYTAYWYAFGIFTKALADRKTKGEEEG